MKIRHVTNLFQFFVDPFMLPQEQVDKGAIKFILSGANIMCPGLTSPGAKMSPIEANAIVVSFHVFSSLFSRYIKFKIVRAISPYISTTLLIP